MRASERHASLPLGHDESHVSRDGPASRHNGGLTCPPDDYCQLLTTGCQKNNWTTLDAFLTSATAPTRLGGSRAVVVFIFECVNDRQKPMVPDV
ncbi:hypothetical protein EVAR_56900_1 [Eumeta japonica]|uniref:Uncharacterized protein n=1 Tax=Eumeta variegata TaxID=151549 RepID=A0A4C1YGG0_EUMVA|nr:hypothetical protein EVAR_56900_1 [Eumeta japonica]